MLGLGDFFPAWRDCCAAHLPFTPKHDLVSVGHHGAALAALCKWKVRCMACVDGYGLCGALCQGTCSRVVCSVALRGSWSFCVSSGSWSVLVCVPVWAAVLVRSVWVEMTPLAIKHGAVNLGQGFPDFPSPAFVKRALVVRVRSAPSLFKFGSTLTACAAAYSPYPSRTFPVRATRGLCMCGLSRVQWRRTTTNVRARSLRPTDPQTLGVLTYRLAST